MSVSLRPITLDERTTFRNVMGVAFGFDPPDERTEGFNAVFEVDRSIAAFDGEVMVGTAGAFSFDLTVPGGALPTAGTTMVSVLSTHRRRGTLRAMMHAHLEEARRHGDTLAALWASESSIYGRFGYGPAAQLADAKIDRRHASLRGGPLGSGSVRLVDVEEAKELLPPLYDQTRLLRPGMLTRSDAWWEYRQFWEDPAGGRDGTTRHRYAVYEESGQTRGYVKYRSKGGWDDDGFPNGEVHVAELQALDLAASDALWRFVFSIDLVRKITHWNLPVDDPLLWLLEESRRLTQRVSDSVWLRLLDVPAALAGRRYSADGRIVIEIDDEFCPQNNGAYLLEADGDDVRCSLTTDSPDLRISVADLASIYLGGTNLLTLAAAGRVDSTPDALHRAAAMFTWHPAPSCPEIF